MTDGLIDVGIARNLLELDFVEMYDEMLTQSSLDAKVESVIFQFVANLLKFLNSSETTKPDLDALVTRLSGRSNDTSFLEKLEEKL